MYVKLRSRLSCSKSTRGIFACTLALTFHLSMHFLHGSTTVGGTLVNQTWNTDGSPYLVTADILVAGLDIEPGVEVLLQGDYVFEVAGILRAIGSQDQPITFTRTNGGWGGIYFNRSQPGSQLHHCIISSASNRGVRTLEVLPSIENCKFLNNSSTGNGGGLNINISSGDLHLIDCFFEGNASAGHGAGVYATVGSGTLTMVGCEVTANEVNPAGANGNYFGGGIYVEGNAEIMRCIFDGNQTTAWVRPTFGGTALGGGGGAYFSGDVTVSNTQMHNNRVRAFNAGPNGCFFGGSTIANGGGIYLNNGSLLLNNSIFRDNILETTTRSACGPEHLGAGVYVNSGECTAINNTFAYNGGEGIYASAGTTEVMNSIIYFNSPDPQFGGNVTISYSNVQGGAPGEGNIDNNPIFFSSMELRIVLGSPCVDAGNPDSTYNDVCFFGDFSLGGDRNDMGAHGGPGVCDWVGGLPPTITRQPRSVIACRGETVRFEVTADGSSPLTYQWYSNTNEVMVRETSATLVLDDVQLEDAGVYRVVISNPIGNVSSILVSLRVTEVCVSINLHAGLTMTDLLPGGNYAVEYVNALSETNNWMPLTNFIAPSPNFLWVDPEPAVQETKFYRVVPLN